MNKTLLTSFLAVAAALSACTTEPRVTVNTAVAAPAATMGASTGSFTGVDRDFALTAASSNLFEIGASQMAQRRAASADVVTFAGMLHQHHTAAQNELAAIMSARGLAVPTSLPPAMHHVFDRLGTTRGYEFDRYFVTDVGVNAHASAIGTFQQQMPALTDPQLKAWAAKTLPVMQQHLQVAQQLAARGG